MRFLALHTKPCRESSTYRVVKDDLQRKITELHEFGYQLGPLFLDYRHDLLQAFTNESGRLIGIKVGGRGSPILLKT